MSEACVCVFVCVWGCVCVCVPGRDGVGKRNEVLRDRIRNRLIRAGELLLPVRRRHKDVPNFIYGDPTPSSIIRQLVSIEPQEVPHLSAAGAGNGDEWLFLTRPFNTLNQAHYKAQVSANGPPWAFLIKTSEETHLNAAPRLLRDATWQLAVQMHWIRRVWRRVLWNASDI